MNAIFYKSKTGEYYSHILEIPFNKNLEEEIDKDFREGYPPDKGAPYYVRFNILGGITIERRLGEHERWLTLKGQSQKHDIQISKDQYMSISSTWKNSKKGKKVMASVLADL